MWRNESAEVRGYYRKLAEDEKLNHRIQYPDYKCSPRKSSEIKKRKRGSQKTSTNIEVIMSTIASSKKRRTNFQQPRPANWAPSPCFDVQSNGKEVGEAFEAGYYDDLFDPQPEASPISDAGYQLINY